MNIEYPNDDLIPTLTEMMQRGMVTRYEPRGSVTAATGIGKAITGVGDMQTHFDFETCNAPGHGAINAVLIIRKKPKKKVKPFNRTTRQVFYAMVLEKLWSDLIEEPYEDAGNRAGLCTTFDDIIDEFGTKREKEKWDESGLSYMFPELALFKPRDGDRGRDVYDATAYWWLTDDEGTYARINALLFALQMVKND